MHWGAKYIGMPYKAGARGPDEVDCWGLVRLAYLNEFAIILPEFPGMSLERPLEASGAIKQGLKDEWIEINHPKDGSLVAMSQREEIHHIGIFADVPGGGKVLHCWNEQRVIAESIRSLRVRGMRTIKFYEYGLRYRNTESI